MHWRLQPIIEPDWAQNFPNMNRLILQLLFNRNLKDKKEMDDFLSADYDSGLYDPFLFRDMNLAIDRLFEAINRGEQIMIYGDYDADGVCSTAVLFRTIKGLGGSVDIYIPFRESEGYSLNKKVVQQIISQGFSLVITVDCGISNKDEIAELKSAGIDTIVLDHHGEPLELPEALAIINPNVPSCGYPESKLCGAGVVFKFLQAVILSQKKKNLPIKLPDGFEKWLLDLVAIATVGDIVPLVKENRVLVKYGIKVLNKTKNIGLQELLRSLNNKSEAYDAEYIGWRIVPRLNAAGRINHASASFYLLTADDAESASKWSEMLDSNNKTRQQLTTKTMSEAETLVAPSISADKKALIALGVGWPAGILGLVAGRLCDKHHRPTLIFSRDEDKFVASGRSIEEFDITDALKKLDRYLARYGGHPQACGLTILGQENFDNFCQAFEKIAEESLTNIVLEKSLDIEAELLLEEIDWDLIEILEKFEPFGEGNPKPLFCAKHLNIEKIQTVGSDGKHLKVMVSQNGNLNNLHKLIGFSFGDWCAKLNLGDKIDIVFEVGVNEWNGNRELQLKIVDLRPSE